MNQTNQPQHPAAREPAFESQETPLFVVGMPRSGTTLLSLMLDAHSRISIPYESHFFIDYYKNRHALGDLSQRAHRIALVERILNERYVRQWDKQLTLDEIALDKCVSLAGTIAAIYKAYARRLGKDFWGDKTPSYLTELDTLNAMFPHSRFLHIIRDARDVSLSLTRQWFGPNDFANGVRIWRERVTIARKMLRMLPQRRVLEIRFEDLVAEPDQTLSKVTKFLGVSFEEQMLVDYRNTAASKVGKRISTHHVHLREQVSASQAHKWMHKLSAGDQALAYEIAGDLLRELNYPLGQTRHFSKPLRKFRHWLVNSYNWRMSKRRRSA